MGKRLMPFIAKKFDLIIENKRDKGGALWVRLRRPLFAKEIEEFTAIMDENGFKVARNKGWWKK